MFAKDCSVGASLNLRRFSAYGTPINSPASFLFYQQGEIFGIHPFSLTWRRDEEFSYIIVFPSKYNCILLPLQALGRRTQEVINTLQ